MTFAPVTNANIKTNPTPNPNPNPNPYTTLNQQPNDNPPSYVLFVARDLLAGVIVTRANVGPPYEYGPQSSKSKFL